MAAVRKADERARVAKILAVLEELYPDVHCELDFKTPLELLIATILSAQCTDARVNMVTPALFKKYRTAKAYAEADPAELEQMIRSTGFYRNKTKSIIGAGRVLVEKFGGQVPKTMDELIQVPGAARKTSNVVLGTAYGIPAGVVVDTHVGRLSRRLGLTKQDDPVKVEQELMQKLPREQWINGAHRIIWHGRRVCDAKAPRCNECKLAPLCPSANLFAPGQKKKMKKKKK